jgi:serine protease Do
MEIVRRGEGRRSIEVKVGELSEPASVAAGTLQAPARSGLGLELAELDPTVRKRLAPETGVLVRRVGPGLALDAGLAPGDVLVEVDGQPVTSVAACERLLERGTEARPVLLRIRRGAVSSFVALRGPGSGL